MKEFIEKQKGDLKAFSQKLEEKYKSYANEVDNTYTHEFLGNQKAGMNVYVEQVKSSAQLSSNLLEKGTHEEIISNEHKLKKTFKK